MFPCLQNQREFFNSFDRGVDGRYFGGPVGRAYVGTLCHAHDSCGIAVDDPKSPAAMTASIMSHEMGHNFGMHHDDDSRCQCPLGDCVMAAAIGYTIRRLQSIVQCIN